MLGVSQAKLAEGVGITFQQVQKYEKGANRIVASRLQRMAEVLDAPISFFFEEGPGQTPPAKGGVSDVLSESISSKDSVALIRAFEAIEDKKVQQKVLSLVRALSADYPVRARPEDQAGLTVER
jgi:transcriptional regulator with XRE-family HTH domain